MNNYKNRFFTTYLHIATVFNSSFVPSHKTSIAERGLDLDKVSVGF
jgi:hypothetical protein